MVQESNHRFRLVFAAAESETSLVASLDPVRPWLSESARRWNGPRWSPAPWVASAAHDLVGRRLEHVVKEPFDRAVRFDFGGGRGLALELMPNRSNLIALVDQGTIMAALRRGKSTAERLAEGARWSHGSLGHGRLDPFRATPAQVDELLGAATVEGESSFEGLRRRINGIGSIGAELIVAESAASGRTPGTVLRDRLDAILHGDAEVLIETSLDVDDASSDRLMPWRPIVATPGRRWVEHGRNALTAGSFYESQEAIAATRARIVALLGILRRELDRTREAEQKVRGEIRSFEDPERQKRLGEALLAGLHGARRAGDVVIVLDPYDSEGRELSIAAPAGRTLTQVADELFKRHRRFKRGLAAAEVRVAALAQRGARLEELLAAQERVVDERGVEALEAAMRTAGLPVGLAGPSKAARARSRASVPRLAGVRMMTSTDGWTILIGRTGPDNDRLTFKIASPDDFWLHAAGVAGAHVVVANPERVGSVPQATLVEAAGAAIWFSDARSQGVADVQWTKRKNVRRAKGGGSGRVLLKRFETIRARAKMPPVET